MEPEHVCHKFFLLLVHSRNPQDILPVPGDPGQEQMAEHLISMLYESVITKALISGIQKFQIPDFYFSEVFQNPI